MMSHKTFIDFLEGKYLATYSGTKEDYEEGFQSWYDNLDRQDLLSYAEEMVKDLQKVCCLCCKPYTEWGNNAMPIKEGQCCDKCNNDKVVPERLRLLNLREIQ